MWKELFLNTQACTFSFSASLKFLDAVKALLLFVSVALRLCNLVRNWVGHLIIDSCLLEGSRLNFIPVRRAPNMVLVHTQRVGSDDLAVIASYWIMWKCFHAI